MKSLFFIALVFALFSQTCEAGWGDFLNTIKNATSQEETKTQKQETSQKATERQPTKEEKQLLDLLIIAKTKKSQFDMSGPPLIKNIDGTFSINKQSSQLSYNNCLTNDLIRTYNTPSDELAEVLLNENQPALFAISSVYSTNGIKFISSVATNHIENLVHSMGGKIKIQPKCQDNRQTDLAWTSANTSEIIVVPRFLLAFILKTNSYAGLNDYELVSIVPYDDLKVTSLQIEQKNAQSKNEVEKLINDYKTKASANDITSVGSIIISFNEYGDKKQKFCTLSYNNDDAMSVIGYREQNEAILTDEFQNYINANKLKFTSGNNSFDAAYSSLNDAYQAITKNKDACNVFVDFPKNIFDLKNALQKEGTNVAYGKLLEAQQMQLLYAQNRGYNSKDEYNFAVEIGANLEQIKKLRNHNASTKDEYSKLTNEMITSKYSSDNDIATLMIFLQDRDEAKKKNISVVAQKNARLAAEKKAQDEELARQRKQAAEYAKNYPYEAVLSCGFNGQHINIAACFSGSQYGVDTELEINNGGAYKMYKPWELQQAGREVYGQGVTISMKKNFLIKAQNTSDTLLLGLKIKEVSTGRVIYEKSVGRFGVVYFQK